MRPVYFFTTSVLLQVAYTNRDIIHNVYTKIRNNVLQFFGGKSITPPVALKSPMETYIDRNLTRFLKTYESTEKYSENIHVSFYEKDGLKQMLIEANNPLELEWKRRILYESTPRGNIMMHYDPYKLGFVYYSDTNIMNVSLLNAAAMKYCITYRCRDLFVDNGVTPENRHSALIPIHFIEPPAKTESVDKSVTTTSKPDNSAFAKFKNYSKQTEKSHPNNKKVTIIEPTVMPPKDVCKNRFIYMGKLSNKILLQPIKKPTNTINGFKSQHLDNLKGETQLQERVLSYKDYKRNANKKDV
jgi:hypothetical protein